MKKRLRLLLIGLGLAAQLVGLSPGQAADHPSYRVETLGQATLALQDETTSLNLVNHGNLAGLAFLEKQNRLDVGLQHSTQAQENRYDLLGETIQEKTVFTHTDFTPSASNYHGLMYWLDEGCVMRADLESLVQNSEIIGFIGGVAQPNDLFYFSGLGGGAAVAWRVHKDWALAAALHWMGASGQPENLLNRYNYLSNLAGNTTQFRLSTHNFFWGLSAAYTREDWLWPDSRMSAGLTLSSDTNPPAASILTDYDPADPAALAYLLGDYSAVVKTVGTILGGRADAEFVTTYTLSPLKLSAETLVNLGPNLETGLLLDIKALTIHFREKKTLADIPVVQDYPLMKNIQINFTPVARGTLRLTEDLQALAGIRYSTQGSGLEDRFRLNPLDADYYRSSSSHHSAGTFAAGLGIQAWQKKLQLAVQYEARGTTSFTTPYSASGQEGLISTLETTNTRLSAGAEYWIIPELAARAGYAWLSDRVTDGTTDAWGTPVDLILSTSRITLGLGVALANQNTVDLMLKLDASTQDPKPAAETSQSALGIQVATRIFF